MTAVRTIDIPSFIDTRPISRAQWLLLGLGLGFGAILAMLAIPAACAAISILQTRRDRGVAATAAAPAAA